MTLTYTFKVSWYDFFVADHIAVSSIKLWLKIGGDITFFVAGHDAIIVVEILLKLVQV